MSVRVEVVCLNPDGSEQRREVLTFEARELAMETLGLSLSEGKALLAQSTIPCNTNKAYEVSITEKMQDPLELNVMYMKAGPAGESCDCCNGSGVKD